jgi:hypothetical protein
MTTSILLLDLLRALLVFGVPVTVFAGIGRISWPVRERTPISGWAWTDLYGNFRWGLHVSSQHSALGRLMEDTPAPTAPGPASPPPPGSR